MLQYQAIILASGKGSRLGALTANKPKCLLPLGSETIIERQIRLLQDSGVSRITMIVGYQRDVLAAQLGERVRMVVNDRYATTGNIVSLWKACDSLSDNTLILNSDIIYERGILEAVMASASPWACAVDSARCRSGHVRMVIQEGRPTDIGIHVPAERSDAAFLGVGLVGGDGIDAFREATERCVQRSVQLGWSKAFLSVAAAGHEVSLCEYSGPWFDINSVATYRKARSYVAQGAPTDIRAAG
jgi:choline kinase